MRPSSTGPVIRGGTTQKVAAGASAQLTAAFDNTQVVEIVANVPVYFSIGKSPVASQDTGYLPADFVIYREVQSGEKVSVLKAGDTDGLCWVTPDVPGSQR